MRKPKVSEVSGLAPDHTGSGNSIRDGAGGAPGFRATGSKGLK